MLNNGIYTIDESQGQKSSFITKVVVDEKNVYALGNKGLFNYDNSKVFVPKKLPSLRVQQKEHIFNVPIVNLVNGNSTRLAYKLDNEYWKETNEAFFDFKYLNQGSHHVIFRYKDNLSNWKETKRHSFFVVYPWYLQS